MNNNELKKSKSLRKYLKSYKSRDIEYLDEINSTNTYLTEKAKSEEKIHDRTLVIAEKQTSGKGRMGRKFHSPESSGIYMSIFFCSGDRGRLKSESSLILTVIAGTAVCEALNKITGCGFFIKWVNDILWDDKKICGILAETKISEFPYIDYAVLGIGINIKSSEYPDEIRGRVISLDEVLIRENKQISISKEEIISEILSRIDEMWDNYLSSQNTSEIIERYRNNLGIIGRKVNVLYPMTGEAYSATVIGINSEANLIVEDENGDEHILNSGEISLKLK